MRVIAVHEVERQTFKVFIELGPLPDKPGWRLFSQQNGVPLEVPPGGDPPLWIRLPEDIAKALADEFSDPRPVATERQLDDAIEMRDRLLTMVENGYHRHVVIGTRAADES